jgi:hypothetical protein
MGESGAWALGEYDIECLDETPIPRWRKLVAFAFGLAAAMGAYGFVAPRVQAWRSRTFAGLTQGASTAPNVGPAQSPPAVPAPSMPSEITSRSSPGAGIVDRTPTADRASGRAKEHKASRSNRRHRSKRRAASRR